jgi:prepilin-type N-terminal cleavage/methylation domain-containing protein
MSTRPVRPLDAGITMLELLAVLAILALVATVAAGRIAVATPTPPSAARSIEETLKSARLLAMRSGRASVIVFEDGRISGGGEERTWDATAATVLLDDGESRQVTGRIVLHPDGSASGPTVTIRENGTERMVPAVPRSLFSALEP